MGVVITVNHSLLFRSSTRKGEYGTVVNVVDGDTIDVDLNGTVERVRYILVNAPELGTRAGQRAKDANQKLLQGSTVRLVKDKVNRDKYGRLLRYVYSGRTFVNSWLVRGGYAEIMAVPPNTAKINEL